MSLLERIGADQATLRRQRDTVAANALGVVIAAATHRAKMISPTRALTDSEVVMVVRAVIKRIDRTLSAITGNPEQHKRAETLLAERAVLAEYLPQPLTDEELATIAMRQHSIMGYNQIMMFLRQYYWGRYNVARATEIVRQVAS